ncbi:MAG: ketosteroid isomerase [Rhizobacter sp.]|nr:ketosteroid isomerase [Rhizobacter sp.]
MPRPNLPQASPDECEQQFYEALQKGDIDQLMAIWSDDDDIVCVQPGGRRLVGARDIRSVFEAMFGDGVVQVRIEKVRKVQTHSMSVHSVIERVMVRTVEGLQEGWVIATNVYQKTTLGWRMVAHHASPGTPHEMSEASEAPAVLH